jgi:GxxExxY protein
MVETQPRSPNDVAREVVDAALQVHRALGPGLLEKVYEAVLTYEIARRGLEVERQVPVPVVYDGRTFDVGHRLDLVVADVLVVEIKSVENLLPVHFKQVLTYLKLTGRHLGLLINFNEALLRDGLHRLVMGLPE